MKCLQEISYTPREIQEEKKFFFDCGSLCNYKAYRGRIFDNRVEN